MADAIIGTNTVKVDAVTQELAALRSTIRLHNWLFGLIVGLLGLTVYSSLQTTAELKAVSAELRAINSRLDRFEEGYRDMQRDMKDQRERLIKLEARLADKKP